MSDVNELPPTSVSSTQAVSGAGRVDATQPVTPPPYDAGAAGSTAASFSQGNAPALPSPGRIDGAQTQAGLDTISQNVSFDFYQVAEILLKLNQEAEKASHDAQIADILSVAKQMDKAADDIRSGAALALAGGIISGAGQIVSGGISVAGGIQSFRIASQAAAPVPPEEGGGAAEETQTKTTQETTQETTAAQESLEQTSTEETPAEERSEVSAQNTQETVEELTEELTASKTDPQKANLAGLEEQNKAFIISQKANSISLKTQGYSQLITGASQAGASGFKYGSDQLQAESKKDEATADTMRATLEREKQYADSLHKSTENMQQTLRDMQQGQHQATSQIMQSRV